MERVLIAEHQSLNTLTDLADVEALKELIHQLADKDPCTKRQCLEFLKQKIKLPSHSICMVDAEELWTLWDELVFDLSELDEYGGGSEKTEDHVAECLLQIEKILKEKEIPKEDREAVIEELLPFIESGNAGMDDLLYDVAYAACKDTADWQYLAESFEETGKDWSLDHARRIYRKIDNREKYLELRARCMVYGGDYHDLVTFYWENGEKEHALSVAQEGMTKATGRMDELHEFMAKHFLEKGERSEFLKIKFAQVTDRLSLNSYERFKKECSPTEWNQYEQKILKILEKTEIHEQLKIRMLRQEYEQALQLLQKIGYPDRFWKDSLVLQTATILETKFPEQILEFYRASLGSCNTNADRKVYAQKAQTALKVRHMLINIMHQPEKWKNLLQEMKSLNKQRKAFLEEFSRVLPDWNTI